MPPLVLNSLILTGKSTKLLFKNGNCGIVNYVNIMILNTEEPSWGISYLMMYFFSNEMTSVSVN